MKAKIKGKVYGPSKNVFHDGPYTTRMTDYPRKAGRFVVVNKRGNWVDSYHTPEEAIARKDQLNLKHAEWIMLKE